MKKLLFLLILILLTSTTTFAQINNDLELICGESISIQDQIYGGDLDSAFSTLPIYDGFSINIDSDITVVEFQCDLELLGNNFGYSRGNIILFQNGNWFESYSFNVWGGDNIEFPTQIKLEPGEYTFVYGNQSSNSWGGSLQDYTQNYSIQYPSDSFEIEFTLTMYDGTCYKEGCVDSEALNYNSVATSDDGSCNYIVDYGELQCGYSIGQTSQIYGDSLDLFTLSGNQPYNALSFEIESSNSIINFSIDVEVLDCNNYCSSSGQIVLFKDNLYYSTHHFQADYWSGIYNSDIPNQFSLQPGEYTLVYGVQTNFSYSMDSLGDYQYFQSNYMENFEIELSLTQYDGSCNYYGCTDSMALNYNFVATNDDGSCNYIVDYGELQCGFSIEQTSQIYGDNTDSFSTSETQPYYALSFEIESSNSIIDFSLHAELLECNDYCNSSGEIIIYKDGYQYNSYYFSLYESGIFSNTPSQLSLPPGVYTIVYGLWSNDYHSYLSDYSSQFTTDMSSGSFEIALSLTQYDGSCNYYGCTDSMALNYNLYANYEDSLCHYIMDLGDLQCGISNYVTESIGNDAYSIINFNVSEYDSFLETKFLANNLASSDTINGTMFIYHDSLWVNTFSFSTYPNITISNIPDSLALELGNYSIVVSSSGNLPYHLADFTNYNISAKPLDIEIELTLYNNNCDYPSCTDISALNYNPIATIDDATCKNVIDYGVLDCGYDYTIHDTMNWVPSSSFQDNDYYNSFSIEVLTDNSILELNLNYQILECLNWCYSPVVWLFKDSTDISSYSFGKDSLHLDAGEYTFIYGLQQNLYSINNLNSIPNNINPPYSSMGVYTIDVEFEIYDGTCDYAGCIDTNALNFNSIANIDDSSCIYPLDLGVLECGISTLFSSIPETSYSNFNKFELNEEMDVTFTLLTSSWLPHIFLYNNEYELIHILDSSHSVGILDTVLSLNQGIYYMASAQQPSATVNWNYGYSVDDYYNFFNGVGRTVWDYFYLSLSTYNGVCSVSGCTDSLALNFNADADTDDGSCDSYHSFGQINCGEDNIYQSDSMIANVPGSYPGYITPNSWLESQKYSSISFEILESSIIEFELDWDLIPINNQSENWCEFHAVLLKDNEVIKINFFALQSDMDTIYRGNNFNPVYLEPGAYSMIIFPDRWGHDYLTTIKLGMNSKELFNDINVYHYNSSCAFYSFNLNLKSFDANCEYIGCSDESAINFIDFVTQSNNSLCDYPTSEMFCGQSFINGTPNTSHYGVVHKSDNIFELQLEVETTISIQNHAYKIFKDNMYNLIFYLNDGNWDYGIDTIELTLGPGKYLFLKEYGEIGHSSVIDCLGCQDDLACNFNEQANISNTICNYVENACDYCLDGVMYNSDLNDNNICDTDEVFGCNDSTAINFNISANVNDLSCDYYPTSQTILLPSGWSMFSTYLEPLNSDLSVVFDMIKENVLIVKNNFGDAYIPDYDYNGIGGVMNGGGYQIKINSSVPIVVLTVFGEFLNPLINPINLDAGWNMIGHLRTDNISAVDIFSELNEQGNLILAKNYLGGAYLPEFEFNGLGYFQPGQGYQVKTYESGYLWILPMSQNY